MSACSLHSSISFFSSSKTIFALIPRAESHQQQQQQQQAKAAKQHGTQSASSQHPVSTVGTKIT
jgi:hypothetical protein